MQAAFAQLHEAWYITWLYPTSGTLPSSFSDACMHVSLLAALLTPSTYMAVVLTGRAVLSCAPRICGRLAATTEWTARSYPVSIHRKHDPIRALLEGFNTDGPAMSCTDSRALSMFDDCWMAGRTRTTHQSPLLLRCVHLANGL